MSFSKIGKKLRYAEKRVTRGLIRWKSRREGVPAPDNDTIERESEQIVHEAHEIIKRRGRLFVSEAKKAGKEFVRAYRDNKERKNG